MALGWTASLNKIIIPMLFVPFRQCTTVRTPAVFAVYSGPELLLIISGVRLASALTLSRWSTCCTSLSRLPAGGGGGRGAAAAAWLVGGGGRREGVVRRRQRFQPTESLAGGHHYDFFLTMSLGRTSVRAHVHASFPGFGNGWLYLFVSAVSSDPGLIIIKSGSNLVRG